MKRDTITLAALLPAGCNTAEQYVTSIITEARTREGRTLDGWTFDPTEATLCMMKATKAVNDAWDEVPIDDPRANDDDAYIIALDRAFRSIVADRDRIRTAIEQPATEEPSNHEPLTVNPEPSTTIDEPAIEQPSMDASPAPVLTAPAPAPSNDPKATPAEVAAVLSTMPDLATSIAVAIRKAAPNFKLMFSIDAVANAARIEWSMPDPTHVTLTATEEDGTIWSQREDVKNGGRRVTVTEADGTVTQFKSVGRLIAYINGQCPLEDAIKSSKKVAKPAAPIEQPAPIEEPASEAAPIEQPSAPSVEEQPSMDAPIDEPPIDEPTIDEQPTPSVEEQPSLDAPIDEPTIDEQPTVSEGQPSMADTTPIETTPNIPKAAATATTEPQREQKHHPKYNDILALVKAGLHIYMYGPAGSGKSTIVQQIAEEMGLKYYITPAPTMEHQLFGFIDANGTYHRTPFRDAYEFGGVSDHPEVDKMVSDLGPALNDAVSNTCYAFPDGVVKKHPDFHFCMSGNTSGHGADGAYVGRHQQDAAFLDRFEVIRIDYDVEVEKKISIDLIGKVDEDAIEFIHDYRKVLSECRPNDVVSPRRLRSLIICAHKAYPGDYEKAVETAVVRDLADQKDDLRNVVMAMRANTNNPYYCAIRTIVQRLFGKGRNKSVAA